MTTESMNHDVSSDELQQKEYAESTQQQQLVDSLKKSSACLEQDALSNCEESINDDALLLNHSLMDDDSDDEHHGSTLTTSSADFTEETPNQRNINDLLFVNHHHDHARDQAERSSSAVALLFQNGRRHAMANAPPTPHRWDHFVRSGTRLKSLLEDAMSEVKTSIVSSARRQKRVRAGGEEGEDEADSSHPRVVTVADFTAELAREKTAQVLQLQRQLKDAQTQAAAVQAANASLREESASSQSRLDRTVEALRIAGSNAAKARADADAAEATAANLAQTLQSLQAVITETKRASQILHNEQQQVTATAANAEAKLLQKEGDLVRAQKELKTLSQSSALMEISHDKWKSDRELLEGQVKKYQQEVGELLREKLEQAAIEKARKDRADKVERECHRAQSMLVEATSGQAAAEQTQAALEETIALLRKANQDLHDTLREQQKAARGDNERLSEALGKVEKEAQRLRIAAEATDEEMQRLKLDKAAADKQIQQLKTRLATVERSLKESAFVAGASVGASTTTSTVSPETGTIGQQLSFHLPPLPSSRMAPVSSCSLSLTDKENKGVENGDLCCICFKQSLGLMKTCQCGVKDCRIKAHANCVKLSAPGPSVSHPCTPAPKLPVVLCGSVMTKLKARNSSIVATEQA